MESELVTIRDNDRKISTTVTYTPEQVAVIKNTVAKGTSDLELAMFLQVAQTTELNPFNKEIWCYKDRKGNVLIFAGRDGFLKKAQQNPRFDGIRSAEIREKDEFHIDIANKKIHHKIKAWGEERGKLKGAYAIVFRKDGEPTIELADFKRYDKGFNTWKSNPEEMIKKVAEAHALKKAFGISGVQLDDDFEVKDGIAKPISARFTLQDEIANRREDVMGCTNEEFLKRVCMAEIGKSMPTADGERDHLRKVMFDEEKYDWASGELSEIVEENS